MASDAMTRNLEEAVKAAAEEKAKGGDASLNGGPKPVVISGHGPVGSSCALFLAKHGVKSILLEMHPKLPRDLRASTFHPPTLDLLNSIGLTELMLKQGLKVDRYQYRDRQTGEVAEFKMDLIADETDFPFRLQLEQYEMTHLAHNLLKEKYPDMCQIMMGTRINSLREADDGVEVDVENAFEIKTLKASFVVGADGASSTVRKLIKVGYGGFTYDERFQVCAVNFPFEDVFDNLSWVNYIADPTEWCVILRTEKLWRVLFPTTPGDSHEKLMDKDYVEERLQRLWKKDSRYQFEHISVYAVHQRVSETYYKGRVALAGDSCHINNPLGGMGMNGGVHDAFCLARKLVRCIKHGADYTKEFEEYDRQRRLCSTAFVQKSTIENKKVMESTDPDVQKKRQADFMEKAGDPKKAKAFILERNMINTIRESFEVKHQKEICEVPVH